MSTSRPREMSIRVAAGVAGVLLALAVYWLLRPDWHLSDDRLYVFVGHSCPHARGILDQLEREPALRDYVVPVLAQPVTPDLDARVCALLAEDVRSRARWLAPFADAWICRRVARWSLRTYDESFFKLPSWSLGREPVHRDREEDVFENQGIERTRNRARPLRLASEPVDRDESLGSSDVDGAEKAIPPEPASKKERNFKMSHWRGQSIGI
jgi:hypothetical protein